MRLFYVALTRAQDKLILTVPLGIGKDRQPLCQGGGLPARGGETLNQQAGSFADWLRAALLVHPNGGPLRRWPGIWSCPLWIPKAPWPSRCRRRGRTPEQEPEERQSLARGRPGPGGDAAGGLCLAVSGGRTGAVPAKVSVTSIVHKAEQTTLERPAFLSKDGLTAAEMGTALHAFLEHADFASLAAAKAAGTLEEAIRAERQRQVATQLVAPEIAAEAGCRDDPPLCRERGLCKDLRGRAGAAGAGFHHGAARVGRAGRTGRASAPDSAAVNAQVLVQGIADIVLVFPDHLELLDYKTDRRKTEADFLRAYRPQLNLYALAIDKRFAPAVTKGIYSLELGRLIEV